MTVMSLARDCMTEYTFKGLRAIYNRKIQLPLHSDTVPLEDRNNYEMSDRKRANVDVQRSIWLP
jgi:hypothetical protein